MDLSAVTWRKASRSQSQSDCVEVALGDTIGAIRDSKNPGGGVLLVDLAGLVASVKAEQV